MMEIRQSDMKFLNEKGKAIVLGDAYTIRDIPEKNIKMHHMVEALAIDYYNSEKDYAVWCTTYLHEINGPRKRVSLHITDIEVALPHHFDILKKKFLLK